MNKGFIEAKGSIRLHFKRNGEVIKSMHFNNLVVALGKQVIAQLLGGALATSITKVSVGTNGTAAADGDTAITTPVTVDISTVSYPTPNQVLFQFSFPAADIGSMEVQELGLFAANGSLFARKATPVYNVPAGTNLDGSWLITINS